MLRRNEMEMEAANEGPAPGAVENAWADQNDPTHPNNVPKRVSFDVPAAELPAPTPVVAPAPAAPVDKDEDLSHSYSLMAEARSTQSNINDFEERMRAQQVGAQSPAASQQEAAPKPGVTQMTVRPWHQEPTLAELVTSVAKSASDMSWKDLGRASLNFQKDIAKGLFIESGKQAAGGVFDAATNTVSGMRSLADALASVAGGGNIPVPSTGNETVDKALYRPLDFLTDLAKDNKIAKGDTVTGHVIRDAARFLIGFVPALRALGGGNAIGTVVSAGAIGDFITRDPMEAGLAELMQNTPAIRNGVVEYLKKDPNDPEVFNRLRNAIEGAGMGFLTEAVVRGIRAISIAKQAVPEIQAQQQLHGSVPNSEVMAAVPEEPFITGGRPKNPLIVDTTSPESIAASEAALRELVPPNASGPGISEAARPVYDDALAQLKAAGLSDEEAAINATVTAARYQTRAERLGDGRAPIDLYNAEGIAIQRADELTATPLGETFNKKSNTLADVERPFVDDTIGTVQEKLELKRKIDDGVPARIIEADPIVQRGMAEQQRNATRAMRIEDITPRYMADREFNYKGETVKGYDNIVPKLVEHAKSYAGGEVAKESKAIILIGPPAAGKSAIAEQLAISRKAAIPDADDAKAVMPEYDNGIGSSMVHEESSVLSALALQELAKDGTNIIVQKIGVNAGSIKKIIDQFEKLGYKTDIINVVIDPDENYRRMIGRYLRTGRLIEQNYFKDIGGKPKGTYHEIKQDGKVSGFAEIDTTVRGSAQQIEASPGFGEELAGSIRGRYAVDGPGGVGGAEGGGSGGSGSGSSTARSFDQLNQISPREYKRVVDAEPADPNYLYYPTTLSQAESIARGGAVPLRRPFEVEGKQTWMDGTANPRAYFTNKTDTSMVEGGKPVLLRISRGVEKFNTEQGSGEFFASKPVSANKVEFLSADGNWQPLGAAERSFNQARPFFSSVENAVTSSSQKAASGSQWLATIKNYGGVTKEEMDWLGLDSFLKGRGKVTKEELGEFINANKVEVQTVTRRDDVQNFKTPKEAEEYLRSTGLIEDMEIDLLPPNEITRLANNAWRDFEGAVGGSESGTVKYSPAAYPHLSLPGGENYRELLLTLPKTDNWTARQTRSGPGQYHNEWEVSDGTRKFTASGVHNAEEAIAQARRGAGRNSPALPQKDFTTGHFEEENVLAHVRATDRVIDGKKTLFIEELQSDWHQQGRKKGYAPKDPEAAKEARREAALAMDKEYSRLHREHPKLYGEEQERVFRADPAYDAAVRKFHEADAATAPQGVPDAPFKKSWPELALKRMIRTAADEGYDQIAWTSGKVQNDRYDLAKQVKDISVVKNADGTFNISATPLDRVGSKTLATSVAAEKIEDFVGKDLAKKVVDDFSAQGERRQKLVDEMNDLARREDNLTPAEARRGEELDSMLNENSIKYSGLDLKVGGKGMTDFYDKLLVNKANELGKKFGAKVERAELTLAKNEKAALSGEAIMEQLGKDGRAAKGIPEDEAGRSEWFRNLSREERDDLFAEARVRETTDAIHVMKITPELKNVATEKGFKLFQGGEATPQGRITLSDNKAVIQLFKTADQSTFMHEAGHLWLDELVRDASGSGPAGLKSDLKTTLDWLGVKKAEDIGVKEQEKWARGFEYYLATGEAPSPGLVGAFGRFKDWLVGIYKSLAAIGQEVPQEIKGVMDRLLATDAEMALAGKTPLVGSSGIHPNLHPYLAPRLQEAGFDGIVTQAMGTDTGPAVLFPANLMAQKIGQGLAAQGDGVPTSVVARSLTASAEANVNRAGIARVLRESDDPIGVTGEAAVAPGPDIFINFGRINAPDDVKQVIRDMADAFKGDINEARRGVQSHEQTLKLAEDLGMTVEDLLNRRKGQPLNAEEATAARMLLKTSTAKLIELSDIAQMPTASLAQQYNFRRMMAVHQAIQNEVFAARTETARALNAWSINVGGDVSMARDIQALIEGSGGSQTTQFLAQQISLLNKQGLMNGATNAMVKKGWAATSLDMVKEAFVTGLLWLPPTHMANFASNTAIAFMQVYQRGLGKRIGDVIGDTGGIVDGEAFAMMYGMISSTKEALRLSARALRTGESGTVIGSKVEYQPAISSATVARERGLNAVESAQYAETPWGKAIDFIGNTVRLPGNVLAAGDEFFKTIGYRGEVSAQALRMATEEGHTGPELWKRMLEIANDPPETIRLAGADAALYSTFQNKLGDFGNAVMKARAAGSNSAGGWLNPMFVVLPFVKTPTNILKMAAENSPVAPIVGRWRDDIAAGGARRELALAKMASGTFIMSVAFDYANNGMITGSGPKDPAKREAMQRTGWQPNSIVIGDKYYSYNRGDPIGMLLGFAATTTEMMKRSDIAPEHFDEASEILGTALGVVSSSVADKTWMQGLSGAFAVIESTEHEGSQGKFKSWADRQTGSFVPASSLNSMFKRFTDPVTREINNPWDSIQAKIAGLSDKLQPALDLWGEERKPQEVYGRAYDVLSPVPVTQVKVSPIDAELIRLDSGIKKIGWRETFTGADVNFHDFPEVRTRYIQLAGNELKHPVYGKGARDFLNDVVEGKSDYSEIYKNVYSDGPKGGKVAWVHNIISDYREHAQQQVLKEYPEFAAWVDARRQQLQELKMPIPLQGQGITNIPAFR